MLASPFRRSPLATLPTDSEVDPRRIHSILLANLRLLIADPGIAERLGWSSSPLTQFRHHSDSGVRLLAVQVLCKQRNISEARRIAMEEEWVGKVDDVDAKVYYGKEMVLGDAGHQAQEIWVD